MAFSDTEKNEILYFFGWPGKTVDPNAKIFNSVVNDRLNNVPVVVETKTRKLLKRLAKLDERLDCAADRLAASKVDDITTNEEEVAMLRRERLTQIRELSDLLNIAIVRTGSNINIGVVS